jgi:hypothetical protein
LSKRKRIKQAVDLLAHLGFPRAQQNERSALCLFALLNLAPSSPWTSAQAPLMGITPIMDWARANYRKDYAPNTREKLRRQTMHQFVDAGIVLYNPDDPDRPVNSPKAVYQAAPDFVKLIRQYDSATWQDALSHFLKHRVSLAERYADDRAHVRVPVVVDGGQSLSLSPGEHSHLIRAVIEDFAPRFAPGSRLIYAGDTGSKWGFYDAARLSGLGVAIEQHGKMPDVILHDEQRNWLLLVEAVTSHGPVDGKRRAELGALFGSAKAGIVYVTAFQTRAGLSSYLSTIAWETEVWAADSPSHLIHFNGERFLGPYLSDTS